MKRRDTLIALLALGAAAGPFAVEAQQPAKVARIGILEIGTPSGDERRWDTFRQRLRELGYVEGQSLVIERRFAEGKIDRLSALASELVRLKVDVIATSGTPPSRAAKNATTSIPIIMEAGDPVGTGLVASLARPGGNVTGFSSVSSDMAGKRLEMLKEALPSISHVAVLWQGDAGQIKDTEIAAQAFGNRIQSIVVQSADDLGSAFSAMTKARAQAVIVTQNPFFADQRGRIVDLAAKHRLPAIYGSRVYAEAGGLMSYGSDIPEIFRGMASYVDKILKGAKPADLPIQQPTKFELVVNMKTAKTLGLTLPQPFLMRADRVIE